MEKKFISKDGSYMRIDMPSPVVIYWETSKTKDFVTIEINFPGKKKIVYKVPTFKVLEHSISELGNMALLLPFYILKIRAELKKSGANSEKRKELAKRLEGYAVEISETLKICRANNYITDRDLDMLFDKLSRLNSELYGKYKGFTEVDMRLEKLAESRITKAEARGEALGETRGRAEGEALGMSKGLQMAAKAMKASGDAISKIVRCTGLSRREIMAL